VKELQMKNSSAPFLSSMIAAVVASLLVVMTVAFLVIPQAMGGHPGEMNSGGVSSTKFHST
jgi:hypothetical protein